MRTLLIFCLSLLPFWCGAEERTLLHAGQARRFIVNYPDTSEAVPAILVIHGGGGSAEQVRRHTDFRLSEIGWVEIYPDALGRIWNDGRHALSGGPLRRMDDLGFLRRLLEMLIAEGRVDPGRIYVTGPSNGGAMSQLLLCKAPDLIAGAAPVIMNFPIGIECPDHPPVPVLFVLGTEDPLVPFNGGPITVGRKDRGAVLPAMRTLAFYAGRNRCADRVHRQLPDRAPFDRTRVVHHRFRNCAAPVEAYIVEGGGHTWPGSKPHARWLVGRTSRDISATEVISAFFRQLARE